MITSIDSLVELLSKKITEQNPNAVARRGSVIHDSFVITAASALSWNSALLEFTKAQTSLDTILAAKTDVALLSSVAEALNLSMGAAVQLLSTSIDRIAANYGLTRKPAQRASGLVYFYVSTAPATDLSVPAGTVVETAQKVQFATTTTVAPAKDSISSFFDPVLNAYAIAAPALAQQSGPNSNVPAGTLIYTTAALPTGFSGVTNKYLVGNGYLAETDEELVSRVKLTLRGSNLETKAGIAALILNNTTVRSVFVADAQSPYQFRNKGKGGVVDIYTSDTIPAVVTDSIATWAGNHVLEHQPVVELLSIPGYTEGVDYELIQDTNILTRTSYRATSYVHWIPAGAHPAGSYTVEYVYNQAIEAVQTLLTADTYRPLMGDVSSAVLAREGIKLDVGISYQVVLHGGYSRSQVINDITTAIQGYVNSLSFGQALAQSDVVNVIENTRGVNYVYTTPLAFNVVGGQIQDVLTAAAYEYLRSYSIVIL